MGDAALSGEADRTDGQVAEAGRRPQSRTGPDLRVVLVEGDVRVGSGGLGADHDGVVLLSVPSQAHPPKREVSPKADREGIDDRPRTIRQGIPFAGHPSPIHSFRVLLRVSKTLINGGVGSSYTVLQAHVRIA